MMTRKIGMLALAAFLCGNASAVVWFVNQETGDDTAAKADDSGNTPFKTIQAAIDKAADDDTVKVGPGTYNTSLYEDSGTGKNRITISKSITLEATGNRDNTVIEGAWHSSENYGLGDSAIRCVCATASCTIKGFTLLNGATRSGDDSDLTSGGGLLVPKSNGSSVKILDCAFVNCSSTRGGGMRRGTACRTVFRNCYASNYGAAAREAYLSFCYFYGCKGKYVTAYTRSLWHCTFHGNNISEGKCVHNDSAITVGNCVFVSGNATFEAPSCVIDGTVTYSNFSVFYGSNTVVPDTKNNCRTEVLGAGVFSPLFGDMRPVKGGPLDGTGNVELKSYLDSGYDDRDVEGNPVDWSDGKLCPGAFQKVIAPASGKMLFCNSAATLTVDGVEVGAAKATNYTYATCWPTQYLLKATSSSDKHMIARMDMYLNGSSSTEGNYRPPLNKDDEVWVTAPPSGTDCAWAPYETKNVFYVDDDAQYDGDADGTEAKPYRTIAEAATNANIRVILVKAGVYSTGTGKTKANGLDNRVQFDNGGYVRMIGLDGAENTFIVGAADPDTKDDPEKRGCGPKAVRCITVLTGGVIQGFTFTGGHSDYGEVDGEDSIKVRGGMGTSTASEKPSGRTFFVDCIISNNVAYRGAMGYGGTYLRCYFADNRTIRNDGGLKGGVAANCIFTGNYNPGGTLRDGTAAYNCTVVENDTVGGVAFGRGDIYNSICRSAHAHPDPVTNIKGTIVDGVAQTSGEDTLLADPCFRDAANGDFRIASVSPAVGFGDPCAGDWWKLAGCDFCGNRYRFVGSKVISGAIQELVPSVRLGVSAGPESGISTSGVVFLDEQKSVTVTAEDAETRLYEGFSINGEIVQDSKYSDSFTYTLGEAMPVPGDTVNAVYLKDWYVNANDGHGLDSNRGDTPDTAKKTLAEAMKHVVAGDVVHAAEGVYGEGSMKHAVSVSTKSGQEPKPITIPSRVIVPVGVSLVADGDRDATIILGGSDPSTANDEVMRGCGPNAVRCVMMETNTVLRGFTLRGGRTGYDNIEDDDFHGGGILSQTASTDPKLMSLVENCTIDDCMSYRGGGSFNGYYRNCRFTGNRAVVNGAASRQGSYMGCYFSGNMGLHTVTYPGELSHCTFGPGNVVSGNDPAFAIGPTTHRMSINGTLFTGGFIGENTRVFTLSNCAYRADAKLGSNITVTDCVTASPEELAQLDENGVPLPGKNPACDRGVLSQWIDAGLDASRDAAGNSRVANGAMDIGCYEADWKGVYSATVGKRGSVTFTEAEPYAIKGDSAEVYLPEGVLSGTLNATGTGRYEFPVRITGGGKLIVSVGDAETEFCSDGVFKVNLAKGEYDLSFAYIPSKDDEGGAFIGPGGRVFGTSVVIR